MMMLRRATSSPLFLSFLAMAIGALCPHKTIIAAEDGNTAEVAAPDRRSEYCGHPLKDIDLYGDDIGSVRGQYDDCCEACKKLAECQAWTWRDYQTGTCFLKKGPGTKVKREGTVSGSMFGLPIDGLCIIKHDIKYLGKPLAEIGAANPDECCTECLKHPECLAYYWTRNSGGTCWMQASPLQPRWDPGRWSGLVEDRCESDATYPDTDILNSDISNQPGRLEDCCKYCRKTQGCVAWAWNTHEEGTCWLKNAREPMIKKTGVTAGTLRRWVWY